MAELLTMPKLGFDMAEGTLIRWVKSEGDAFTKGEVLAEIETDKATVEVEAQNDSVLLKHLVEEGSIVPVGNPIAVTGEAGEDPDSVKVPAGQAAPAPEPEAEAVTQPSSAAVPATKEPVDGEKLPAGIKVSPLARRLAREHSIDLLTLKGTGPGGRVVKRDIETRLAEGPPARALISTQPSLQTERIPLSRLRETIGRRMTASKQNVPHFYLTADLNAEKLMALRSELNALMPEGIKLSVNDFVVKAAALSMLEFPNLNASIDGDAVIRHGEINIGIAVAVENGLLTVVNRNSDQKSLRHLSQEIKQVIGRARDGKVKLEDIEGSTFTVSNLGMFDIDSFTAIINPPEAAILAVGSVRDVPVVRDGVLVPGKQMKVTLSADHRVTDGAEAARWMQVFRRYIEEPLLLAA